MPKTKRIADDSPVAGPVTRSRGQFLKDATSSVSIRKIHSPADKIPVHTEMRATKNAGKFKSTESENTESISSNSKRAKRCVLSKTTPSEKTSATSAVAAEKSAGKLPNRAMEFHLMDKGMKAVCGVDEAGRGPLAGPVVAAAIVLPRDFDTSDIDDSKKLTEDQVETSMRPACVTSLIYEMSAERNVIHADNI
jgi:hypothetical protein